MVVVHFLERLTDMYANPKTGVNVVLRYKNKQHKLNGKFGRVVIASRGKPRNHGVRVDDVTYVIPCGQLFPLK